MTCRCADATFAVKVLFKHESERFGSRMDLRDTQKVGLAGTMGLASGLVVIYSWLLGSEIDLVTRLPKITALIEILA